tara:strand:- start:136 stop:627 length:492 start_codon:yes stop_codon:yes gene_type:complete
MILQYFKKKENEYKKIADKIYVSTLLKSKELSKDNFFKEVNFDSSFELISIILIFYLKTFKNINKSKYQQINDELVKNLINDLDKTLREIGIGDMSIGKYVKKYVKKFYYRIKVIDEILDNYNKERFIEFLASIKTVNNNNTSQMATELMIIYEKIKQNAEKV